MQLLLCRGWSLTFREDKNLALYRVEYNYMDEHMLDWMWLESIDDISYLTTDEDVKDLTWRPATDDEVSIYDSAFADGHGLAMVESRMERSNEVYFEITNMNINEDGRLDTRKIFTCGVCEKTSLDFDTRAAKTGEFYVTKDIDSILWHVCIECAYDCRHDWTHFSRSVCACGSMHDYCDTCGEAVDNCPYALDIDSPYRRKKKK